MTNKLTQKQEASAQAYILHNGNQSAAYRSLHPDSDATPKSIVESASRDYSNVNVLSRIQELQDMATERHLVTVASLTAEFDENREVGKVEGQSAAMTAATTAKAKLHGHMTDKLKVSGVLGMRDLTKMTESELDDYEASLDV